ncbi:hypothetical protein GQ53DRAFT_5510 [Thozetella sp. PMI_491]|nr:hypothetical protein GQ53DRAFT_5510 [Thozetella sp. PMI_491]
MYAKTAAALLFAAAVEARFGQEQGNGAITAIGALTDLGSPGQAATLAGGSIQFLLAAANPCGKLTQADNIIKELGTSDAAVAAARGLVAAEQNFNPFVVSVPSICNDPTLPASPELRGVVPLIDPAVTGSNLENANSATSVKTPFSANGLSVAQIMVAQGFSNFTAVDASGNKVDASTLSGASGSGSNTGSNNNSNTGSGNAADTTTAAAAATTAATSCAGQVTVTVTAGDAAAVATTAAASSGSTGGSANAGTGAARDTATCTGSGSTKVCPAPATGAGAVTDAVKGNFDGFVASSISGLDFGLCVPTIKFEAGLNGRKDTENTFQAIDPLVNQGQQEALNPAIITNRIKDQLTNVCGANQAAKDAVVAAAAKVAALGVRDVTVADTWNTELGFAGTNTNPDNAPQTGLVGHT